MAELKCEVSVETVVIDAISSCLQDICNKHGIKVESFHIDWFDHPRTTGETRAPGSHIKSCRVSIEKRLP